MTELFRPQQALISDSALGHTHGRKILARLQQIQVPTTKVRSLRNLSRQKDDCPQNQYATAKRTLFVTVRKSLTFSSCKPSADYQLPLATSCPGLCQYCYLQTRLGTRPVIKAYANLDQILTKADFLINQQQPETTSFEGSATSDPLAIEHITGSLKETIEFFSEQQHGRFRFVSKFSHVHPLLNCNHQGKTEIRFSVNSEEIVGSMESGAAALAERIQAAADVAQAGYPFGFLIAPVIVYPGWKQGYNQMLEHIQATIPQGATPRLEIISHRYTPKAKTQIQSVFPDTDLDMDDNRRQFKYGQFGYGKYVYPPPQMEEIRQFFHQRIAKLLPSAEILYII